jgi:uncharacterized protein (DUF1778 family)
MKKPLNAKDNVNGAARTVVERTAKLEAQTALQTQRLFVSNNKGFQDFVSLLERHAVSNIGLHDLFSRQAPWEKR